MVDGAQALANHGGGADIRAGTPREPGGTRTIRKSGRVGDAVRHRALLVQHRQQRLTHRGGDRHVAHLPVHGVEEVQFRVLLHAVVFDQTGFTRPGFFHGSGDDFFIVEACHAHLRGAALNAGAALVVVVEQPEGQLVAVGHIAHTGREQHLTAVQVEGFPACRFERVEGAVQGGVAGAEARCLLSRGECLGGGHGDGEPAHPAGEAEFNRHEQVTRTFTAERGALHQVRHAGIIQAEVFADSAGGVGVAVVQAHQLVNGQGTAHGAERLGDSLNVFGEDAAEPAELTRKFCRTLREHTQQGAEVLLAVGVEQLGDGGGFKLLDGAPRGEARSLAVEGCGAAADARGELR